MKATRAQRARAQRIGAVLDERVGVPIAPLKAENPFTFLVAVILSAQCTDARVNLVTPKLFTRANSPAQMAALGEGAIKELIASCGLANAKARAIRRMSQMLLDRFDGNVPGTLAELEQLPGVGHKTASVVLWQCFHLPAFPVDTHIFRCAKRWGLSDGKTVVEVEGDLKRWFPPEEWGQRHLQIILFGRKFCPARGHKIADCPICRDLERPRR